MLVRYRVDGIFVSDVVFNSYRTESAPFSSIPADWCQHIGNIAQAEKMFFPFAHVQEFQILKSDPAA